MKIAYLSGAALPSDKAQSVHVMKMCSAFKRQDIDITLFAKRAKQTRNIYEHYAVRTDFPIQYSAFGTIRFLSGIFRILKSLGIRGTGDGSYDCLYARDPIALLAKALIGPPSPKGPLLIFEAHQMPISLFEKMIWDMVLPRLSGLICITEALKADIESKYPKFEKPVFVAPDGADFKKAGVRAIPKAQWPGRQKAFQVGYAGSLHPGKGIEILIKIAELLPEMDFHVMGGQKKQIKRIAIRAPSNIYFHGHIPPSEVQRKLLNCGALLAPYQNNIKIANGRDIARWTSPLKLFEYMAAQRPILCSDLPVMREVLQHGRNAILIGAEDVYDWVEALGNVSRSKVYGESLAQEAYKDLLKLYTWDRRAENVLRFIQNKTY